MQFIDLAAQYSHLKTKIDRRIQDVLNHGAYIMGPEVFELEEKLADYVGVKHAISCANGTDALSLAMMSLDIKAGDAVFCPTFTFFATAEAVAFVGANPIFVDSDIDTYNICVVNLEKQIKHVISEGRYRPRAIIAVDLFGLPANYPEIEVLANKYNLKIIEDAAQGFGGAIHGKRSGSFGDIATTSFFPAKPLGCYGDGGAVFTNSDHLADLVRSFRVHGKGKDKYDNVRIGMNSRLDTIQAAILLEKLHAFPAELEARNLAANNYASTLGASVKTPIVPKGYTSSWAQYTIQSDDRAVLIEKYKKNGIPTAIYYAKCLHKQTAFRHIENQGDFPNAEKLSRTVLSLPMHGYMSA